MVEKGKKGHIINLGSSDTKVSPISPQLYSEDLEERYQRDNAYSLTKNQKIQKEFNNSKTHLREVANFLWDLVRDNGTGVITTYDAIAKVCKISEGVARICVGKLNYWDGYALTWIPVPKKAGHIQNVLKNEGDYDKWNLKKEKTIVSMEQVKQKAKRITKTKWEKKQPRRKLIREERIE